MAHVCPQCGAPYTDEREICASCGASVVDANAQPDETESNVKTPIAIISIVIAVSIIAALLVTLFIPLATREPNTAPQPPDTSQTAPSHPDGNQPAPPSDTVTQSSRT